MDAQDMICSPRTIRQCSLYGRCRGRAGGRWCPPAPAPPGRSHILLHPWSGRPRYMSLSVWLNTRPGEDPSRPKKRTWSTQGTWSLRTDEAIGVLVVIQSSAGDLLALRLIAPYLPPPPGCCCRTPGSCRLRCCSECWCRTGVWSRSPPIRPPTLPWPRGAGWCRPCPRMLRTRRTHGTSPPRRQSCWHCCRCCWTCWRADPSPSRLWCAR